MLLDLVNMHNNSYFCYYSQNRLVQFYFDKARLFLS